MEFLLVQYVRKRRVVIDDEPNGLTNQIIELEAGAHTVTLGPGVPFKPAKREIDLSGTNALEPFETSFA